MSVFLAVSNWPFSLFIFHCTPSSFMVFQSVILRFFTVYNIYNAMCCGMDTRLVRSDHNFCKIGPLVSVLSVHAL